MMNRVPRFCRRTLVSGSLIGLSAAIGLSCSVEAQTFGPLVQVTNGDPFATCTADKVQQQENTYGSSLFPNTAIEPWVAADPTSANGAIFSSYFNVEVC
jgi:hypothetical protein